MKTKIFWAALAIAAAAICTSCSHSGQKANSSASSDVEETTLNETEETAIGNEQIPDVEILDRVLHAMSMAIWLTPPPSKANLNSSEAIILPIIVCCCLKKTAVSKWDTWLRQPEAFPFMQTKYFIFIMSFVYLKGYTAFAALSAWNEATES